MVSLRYAWTAIEGGEDSAPTISRVVVMAA
jgi:hypothetical protein